MSETVVLVPRLPAFAEFDCRLLLKLDFYFFERKNLDYKFYQKSIPKKGYTNDSVDQTQR